MAQNNNNNDNFQDLLDVLRSDQALPRTPSSAVEDLSDICPYFGDGIDFNQLFQATESAPKSTLNYTATTSSTNTSGINTNDHIQRVNDIQASNSTDFFLRSSYHSSNEPDGALSFLSAWELPKAHTEPPQFPYLGDAGLGEVAFNTQSQQSNSRDEATNMPSFLLSPVPAQITAPQSQFQFSQSGNYQQHIDEPTIIPSPRSDFYHIPSTNRSITTPGIQPSLVTDVPVLHRKYSQLDALPTGIPTDSLKLNSSSTTSQFAQQSLSAFSCSESSALTESPGFCSSASENNSCSHNQTPGHTPTRPKRGPNKSAADKYRRRKKERFETMQADVDRYTRENTELNVKATRLEDEKAFLTTLLESAVRNSANPLESLLNIPYHMITPEMMPYSVDTETFQKVKQILASFVRDHDAKVINIANCLNSFPCLSCIYY